MAGMFIGAVFISYNISYFFLAFLSFIAFRELLFCIGIQRGRSRSTVLGHTGYPHSILSGLPCLVWSIHHLHSGSHVPRIAFTARFKGRYTRNHQVDGTVAMDSDAFGIRYQPPRLSPVTSRTTGIQFRRRGLLLFLVFLTEINDIMQFIWGKLLGRHKILPKVSPNKTWEGFLGGVISTTVIGYFLGFLTPLSAPNVILVSALLAIAGFSGDVVISAIKRDKGIKDMGNSIPGHGGVFDRIDSLSYTAPVFFHLVYYIAY